jgi:hypothetical protein
MKKVKGRNYHRVVMTLTTISWRKTRTKGGPVLELGERLRPPQASDDDEDGSEDMDPEQDEEDEDEDQPNSSDESDGPEEHVQESAGSTVKPKGRLNTFMSLPTNPKELPFTFQCPSSHEEFLEILEGLDRADIGTVIECIRKLHHPSLGEKHKSKLQVCLPISRYFKLRLILIQDLTSAVLGHTLYVG